MYQHVKTKHTSIKIISLKLTTECGNFYFPGEFKDKISNFAEQYYYYIPWLNYLDVLIVKFEDLIGPKGGEILDQQQKDIKIRSQ